VRARNWHHNAALATALLVAIAGQDAFAQAAPPLGQTASFAVLAGSAVSNTGATAITGDVGVSPGTAITGFPPETITGGAMYSNDAFAQGAQSDLVTAYNALAGQACNTNLTGQDLGGLTLTSAVYCLTTSAQLTGILTLDAQNNPNANFVFQIGSTLTTASASQVVVINGGSDCNVFWQVGSSATLGTGTQFVGTTFALTSITLTTGSSSNGSLLARNGGVTMDTNQVRVCAPTTPVTLQTFTVG
jgi:type VI secretion system secreted protein VgrG